MSVDYSAKIVVGLRRQDFPDQTDLADWIDEGDLEVCPPCYDGGGRKNAVVGLEYLSCSTYGNVAFDWNQKLVDDLKTEFKEITGLGAKVYLSTHGY